MRGFAVAKQEMKLGLRNKWSYTFLFLFALFALALFGIHAQASYRLQGYTHMLGTLLNLLLYLLPMMTLLLGSFSITSEKEDGRWQLLATYSLPSIIFLTGKYLGTTAMLLAIIGIGFGLSGAVSLLLSRAFPVETLITLLLFSAMLIVIYLALSMVIGAISKSRWQALIISVGVWFITILAWPTLLISGLSYVPYRWIRPSLELATLLNPAEMVRIFTVIKIGGGSVFGPDYYKLVDRVSSNSGTVMFIALYVSWILIALAIAVYFWERAGSND